MGLIISGQENILEGDKDVWFDKTNS
jgi:hypothetical protein